MFQTLFFNLKINSGQENKKSQTLITAKLLFLEQQSLLKNLFI